MSWLRLWRDTGPMPEGPPGTPNIVSHGLGDDPRGASFSVSAEMIRRLPGVRDVHIMTMRPGAVRGNHYHRHKNELLVVLHSDSWELHWSVPNAESELRRFSGRGGVTIEIPARTTHTLVNTGIEDLTLIGISPVEFDAHDPDVVPHRL